MGDIITALQNTPVPTILVVGGIVFLFLAVVGQFAGKIQVDPKRQKLAGIIGALLLLSGVALYVVPVSPSVEISTSEAMVKITSHSNRSTVPRVVDIKGQHADVPEGVDIWLYVYAPGIQRYFLDPVTTFTDGTWEAKGVTVGSTDPSDVGAAFRIGVLLANQKTSEQIWEKPDDLGSLPSGTEKRDEIVVYRE